MPVWIHEYLFYISYLFEVLSPTPVKKVVNAQWVPFRLLEDKTLGFRWTVAAKEQDVWFSQCGRCEDDIYLIEVGDILVLAW